MNARALGAIALAACALAGSAGALVAPPVPSAASSLHLDALPRRLLEAVDTDASRVALDALALAQAIDFDGKRVAPDFEAATEQGARAARAAEAALAIGRATTVEDALAAALVAHPRPEMIGTPPLMPAYATFAEALDAIAVAHGVMLREEDRGTARLLDAEAPGLASAAAEVVAVHVWWLATTRAAVAAEPHDGGLALHARDVAARRLVELMRALPEPAPKALPIVYCEGFAFDFSGRDSEYDCAQTFQLDVGGNDTYLNNAGGGQGHESGPQSAMLVDAGGDDRYGGSTHNALNGGGLHGTGFLLDRGGNDDYWTVGGGALNGGAIGDGSSGTLIDLGGDDIYFGSGIAVNGAAFGHSSAFLFDAAGDDVYGRDMGMYGWVGPHGEVTGLVTNGGAAYGGNGRLVDLAGDDSYRCTGYFGSCGGATALAVSLFLDGQGVDGYYGGNAAPGMGAGASGALGIMLDLGNEDDSVLLHSGSGALTAGAGRTGGIGLYLTEGGDDEFFEKGPTPSGLGIGLDEGMGIFLDDEGDDSYRFVPEDELTDPRWIGFGEHSGTGIFIDRTGNDRYEAVGVGRGVGMERGVGFLLDYAGINRYHAIAADLAHGAAASAGIGVLLDRGHAPSFELIASRGHGAANGGAGILLLTDPAGVASHRADAASRPSWLGPLGGVAVTAEAGQTTVAGTAPNIDCAPGDLVASGGIPGFTRVNLCDADIGDLPSELPLERPFACKLAQAIQAMPDEHLLPFIDLCAPAGTLWSEPSVHLPFGFLVLSRGDRVDAKILIPAEVGP